MKVHQLGRSTSVEFPPNAKSLYKKNGGNSGINFENSSSEFTFFWNPIKFEMRGHGFSYEKGNEQLFAFNKTDLKK